MLHVKSFASEIQNVLTAKHFQRFLNLHNHIQFKEDKTKQFEAATFPPAILNLFIPLTKERLYNICRDILCITPDYPE